MSKQLEFCDDDRQLTLVYNRARLPVALPISARH